MREGDKWTLGVCDYCKKEIVKGDEFILLGKYPSAIKIRLSSASPNFLPPENFGQATTNPASLRA